ncbi:hypothetical protein RS982_18470 [Stenotrophomonas indicatrix]|uniref:XVIPCD domain-containing protein n=1 Tax=Stenotrophomonas indicatrix TaxID=2045451 RepID=UPI0028EFF95E|nr:XVIPCD domain-containing protein [Stenotrophomonas indicatrix]MDT9583276.1 hypothetical protein [Stenotrophomonas indicatrix]
MDQAALTPCHCVAERVGTSIDDSPSLHRVSSSTAELGDADRSLYMQIRAGVERLDAEHGKPWDESSQRMTTSLLVLVKEQGLSRVDHVVLNNPTESLARGAGVFIVEGAVQTSWRSPSCPHEA